MPERKMTDKDIEYFVKNNPEAYRRFKRARLKKSFLRKLHVVQKIWSPISKATLWICAVGGFVLSLFNAFQGK